MSNIPPGLLSSKKCGQCGAENDLILSNCRYCNSSLPRIDLGSIPEELLLSNCSYWLAKLEDLKDYRSYSAAKQAEETSKIAIIGAIAKLTTSGPSLSDIIGNTDQYIRALSVRAQTSLEFIPHILEFKQRQQAALTAIEANRRKKKNRTLLVPLVAVCVLFLIALTIYFTVLAPAAKREVAEEAKLAALVEKAEQAIARGDKNSARFYVSQIKWDVPDEDGKVVLEKAKAWDEKREAMLKAIEP
jgi:hypothetical protein